MTIFQHLQPWQKPSPSSRGVIKYFADDRCIVANKGTWGWKHQDVLFPPHRREPSYMAFFVPKVNVSARGIAWNSKHNTKIIWNPRYRVSQLAFLIIAHIAWRASNQLGHCVPERFNMGGILLFCSENPTGLGSNPRWNPGAFPWIHSCPVGSWHPPCQSMLQTRLCRAPSFQHLTADANMPHVPI